MNLSGKQRRYLRSLGHHLNPVVTVGAGGVSKNLLEQIETQLNAHELIKVKVLEGSRPEMKAFAEALSNGSHSEVAQVLGKTVLLYRAHPEDPRIELP